MSSRDKDRFHFVHKQWTEHKASKDKIDAQAIQGGVLVNLKLLKATLQSEKAKQFSLNPGDEKSGAPTPVDTLKLKIIDELFNYPVDQLANFDVPRRYYEECFELLIAAWRRRIHQSYPQTLTLQNIKFTKSSFKAFAVALSLNTSMQALRLEHCHLTPYEVQLLAVFIKIHPSLIYLHLDHNPITDDGMSLLINALFSNDHIEHLSLVNTDITDRSALKLYEQLQKKRYKTLRLDKNHLTERSLKPIRKIYENSQDLFMFDEQ